jgi:CheY-like chemotaxis protein
MDKQNVLWVDNDPAFVLPFAIALNELEFQVVVARTVSEAEAQLKSATFAAVILDVMIPVTDSELSEGYGAEATDESHQTGLVFYRRVRSTLEERHIPTLILTVRVDKGIMNAFAAEGVRPDRFATKMELREADALVARIRQLVRTEKGV